MSVLFNGAVPEFIIYEDELTLAFLDYEPKVMGHTLIIPKVEVDNYFDVPEEYYLAVYKTARLLGPVILKAFNSTRVNQAVSGYHVPHFHLHLYPSYPHMELTPDHMYEEKDDLNKAFQLITSQLPNTVRKSCSCSQILRATNI